MAAGTSSIPLSAIALQYACPSDRQARAASPDASYFKVHAPLSQCRELVILTILFDISARRFIYAI